MAVLKGLVVVVILAALGLFGGGLWQLHETSTGQKVVATVTECHYVPGGSQYGGHTTCSGSWVEGGSLLGNGHVVLGTISGIGSGDVGKKVTVRAHGDSASTLSHTTAIVLFSVGVGLLFVAGWFIWAIRTGRADGSRSRTRVGESAQS